ncbi:MAG: hypothetical protein KDD10_09210 [Phaeodactylibacter sp.]|nr:hypothetical protein [Phaeodactylibacter sp.]MCB9296681.1 hypothetical protein [Lewinellaceae bacterium]
MKLLSMRSGEETEAEIARMEEEDYNEIASGGRFSFDWKKERENLVYKIRFIGREDILGLISLIDIPKEYRLHINLIESSAENQGKNKLIGRIPGCLIAYAARLSILYGYEGFVSLKPKTALIDHYIAKYGFSQYGMYLAIFREASGRLIAEYLDYEL